MVGGMLSSRRMAPSMRPRGTAKADNACGLPRTAKFTFSGARRGCTNCKSRAKFPRSRTRRRCRACVCEANASRTASGAMPPSRKSTTSRLRAWTRTFMRSSASRMTPTRWRSRRSTGSCLSSTTRTRIQTKTRRRNSPRSGTRMRSSTTPTRRSCTTPAAWRQSRSTRRGKSKRATMSLLRWARAWRTSTTEALPRRASTDELSAEVAASGRSRPSAKDARDVPTS
mmetsp:Transcript_143642/g.459596  ORF Transcript_143642/g.459596 Transcript_143642/m.459596 type:complete len:227 (-) Transcript_143642:928-1608(-)